MKYLGENGEHFEMQEINKTNCSPLKEQLENTLRLLWFTVCIRAVADKKLLTFELARYLIITKNGLRLVSNRYCFYTLLACRFISFLQT